MDLLLESNIIINMILNYDSKSFVRLKSIYTLSFLFMSIIISYNRLEIGNNNHLKKENRLLSLYLILS